MTVPDRHFSGPKKVTDGRKRSWNVHANFRERSTVATLNGQERLGTFEVERRNALERKVEKVLVHVSKTKETPVLNQIKIYLKSDISKIRFVSRGISKIKTKLSLQNITWENVLHVSGFWSKDLKNCFFLRDGTLISKDFVDTLPQTLYAYTETLNKKQQNWRKRV